MSDPYGADRNWPTQPPIPPGPQTNFIYLPPRRVNHGLHLVLTLLTCGLWAPVWIIDAMRK